MILRMTLKFTGKKTGIITMTQRSKIKTAKIQCISQLKKHSFKSLLLNFEAIGISYGSEINKRKKRLLILALQIHSNF